MTTTGRRSTSLPRRFRRTTTEAPPRAARMIFPEEIQVLVRATSAPDTTGQRDSPEVEVKRWPVMAGAPTGSRLSGDHPTK